MVFGGGGGGGRYSGDSIGSFCKTGEIMMTRYSGARYSRGDWFCFLQYYSRQLKSSWVSH